MAFKTVTDLSADVTISLGGVNKKTKKANPFSVEGYYLGTRQVADKKKKSGLSNIYFFQTLEGNVGVWGKTDMDNKMLSVTPGNKVRISYDRMVPTPNGDMYKYRVEVDEDDIIEVSDTPMQSYRALAEDDDFNVSDDDSENDSEAEYENNAASQYAASPTRFHEVLNRAKLSKSK